MGVDLTDMIKNVAACNRLDVAIKEMMERLSTVLESGAAAKDLAVAFRAAVSPADPNAMKLGAAITMNTSHVSVVQDDPLVPVLRSALESPTEDRRAHIESIKLALDPDRIDIAKRVVELTEQVEQKTAEADIKASMLDTATEQLAKMSAALSDLTKQFGDRGAQLDALRGDLADKTGTIDQLSKVIDAKSATIAAAAATIETLTAQLATKSAKLDDVGAQLATAVAALNDSGKALAGANKVIDKQADDLVSKDKTIADLTAAAAKAAELRVTSDASTDAKIKALSDALSMANKVIDGDAAAIADKDKWIATLTAEVEAAAKAEAARVTADKAATEAAVAVVASTAKVKPIKP